MQTDPKSVNLFIPCLIDQVYPEMGVAVVRVLERLGYRVHYDPQQTCCGQPAFNAGHWREARCVAEQFLDVFSEAEIIVCPSGSCTAMVRTFYRQLFPSPPQAEQAERLQGRILELSEFLSQPEPLQKISGRFTGTVGFHHSCHSYRELKLQDEWRRVMERIQGYRWVQPSGEPVCCGFGGVFSVKFAAISAGMAKTRLEQFAEAGAETVVSNDPGCIMQLRQEAAEKGFDMRILHLSEFLHEAMQ